MKTIVRSTLVLLGAFLSISLSAQSGSGECLTFDGVNDYVNGHHTAQLNAVSGTFTMELWANPTNIIGTGPAENCTGISGTGGWGQRYAIYPQHGSVYGAGQAGAGISVGTNRIAVYEHAGGYMPAVLVYDLPSAITDWTHIAVVYTAGSPALFINGKYIKTGQTSCAGYTVHPSAQIGGVPPAYGMFQGDIDEVKIWSVARTQREIRESMCAKVSAPYSANLIRYYQFEDGSGSATVTDLTGNRDGSLISMNPVLDWVTSGASIGDNNVFVYPNDWGENAISFDGTNDRVVIPDDAALDVQDEITVEFWFKLNGNSGDNAFPRPVSKGQTTPSDGAYGIFVRDATAPTDIGMRFIDVGGATHDIRSTSVPNYNDGNWHHVAAVYSNSQDQGWLYVDGALEVNPTISGNTQIRVTADELYIGGTVGSSNRHFNGEVDEVRIWNTARTSAEISNDMCRTLFGNESGLVGYWRMDEGNASGTTVDCSANSNDGTLTNMTPASDWVNSGITCSWTGLSLTHVSGEKDSLQVSAVAGTPDGLFIYHIDAAPNNTTGATGIGGNDQYYGVFKTGGVAPSYTATYFYAGNDAFEASEPTIDENDMALFTRTNNASAAWADASATVNTTANTLTATAISTEFLLGMVGGAALPIELLDFSAHLNGNQVDLTWTTATETNNAYFTVERSQNGQDFEEVLRVDGAGNSSSILSYFDVDYTPLKGVSYYRLKQTDFDGQFSFSGVVAIEWTEQGDPGLSIFPNPAQSSNRVYLQLTDLKDQEVVVVLRDIKGVEYYSKVVMVESDNTLVAIDPEKRIPAGVYLVTAASNNHLYSRRLVITER